MGMKKMKNTGLRYCCASRMFLAKVEIQNPSAERESAASATTANIGGKMYSGIEKPSPPPPAKFVMLTRVPINPREAVIIESENATEYFPRKMDVLLVGRTKSGSRL